MPTNNSAMAERPHGACSAIVRGWVTLTQNFRLKCYLSRQYLRMGEWLYNNFATGSFHTKKLCSRLYLIEIEFYLKSKHKSLFEPPIGGVRGNVCTPSIKISAVHCLVLSQSSHVADRRTDRIAEVYLSERCRPLAAS